MSQSTPLRRGVLPPDIRTFKPRRSRMSRRQGAALRDQAGWLIDVSDQPLDLPVIWGSATPVVLEIGFGTGEATALMAESDPGTGILAVDVHTPGVGNLLDLIARRGLTNVRVMEADAVGVLRAMIPPSALAGVRSFFPDPWPKARHHKRRLVQQPIMDLVRSRLTAGGFWHVATDWPSYADAIRDRFDADPEWTGGEMTRPTWRPETRYERRAQAAGRHVSDLEFRIAGPAAAAS